MCHFGCSIRRWDIKNGLITGGVLLQQMDIERLRASLCEGKGEADIK